MTGLLLALLGAVASTNPPAAVSNLVQQTTGIAVSIPATNDPVQLALDKLMADDDAAQTEVDNWILENQKFVQDGAGISNAEMNRRILKRFAPIHSGYEDLVRRYPKSVDVRVAYASFLNDLGEMEEAIQQLKVAADLNPTNAATWNNLGVYYSDGHHGPPIEAFPCFEKAVEFNPHEPLYFQNFAVTVFMYRPDAREYYHIQEPQVFDKALDLYGRAMRLDPTNFALAVDTAESYYTIRPLRTNDALVAWTNALNVAQDELNREEVYIHLARIKMLAGRYKEARGQLNLVTNDHYITLKTNLSRALAAREALAASNAPPETAK
ncbi:MAG: tetratricopeptide repeat protein [Verrucomicrobiota bacterium]